MKDMKFRTIATVAALCSIFTICSCGANNTSKKEKSEPTSITSPDITDENIETTKADEVKNIKPVSASEEKKIFGEFNSENLWIIDPAVPENVITLGSFPIKVKVVSKEDAHFFNDDILLGPSTPYKIELLDAYNNSDVSENIDTLYMSGGDVTVEEVIARLDQESIVKYGLDKVNEGERKTTYLSYVSDYGCELIPGEEYIILAKRDENGCYYISCSGYGVFKRYSSNAKSNVYKNVITNIEFKIN